MIKKKYLSIFVFSILIICSCNKKQENKEENKDVDNFEAAQAFYLKNINTAISYLDSLALIAAEHPKAKLLFTEARKAFKKAEPYASYLNPEVGHKVNGPALPIYKEDTGKILLPLGLQKIEESIFEGGVSEIIYKREVNITKGLMHTLKDYVKSKELNAQRFFIATHQQLLRVISHSISGFDTPISHLGIKETIVSLESLKKVYNSSLSNIIREKNAQLNKDFLNNIDNAINFINGNLDFDTFDRYTFLRDCFNPITRNWVAIRKESGLWKGVNNKPFNFDAPTFFESNSFNVDYFKPTINRNASDAQRALGKKLFFEPRLSKKGKMACATCHIPEKGYTDGLAFNIDNSGKKLQRNTPTLINSVFQKGFFLDGRSPTLEDQISSVFTNKKEFAGNVHQFSTAILKDTSYYKLFEKAFGKIPTKNIEIIKAISSYVSTLNGFNSKFDKNIRAEENSFTNEEKLGMNLFMGKALCATCHFMPLTNGTVPPFFTETEKEVIGVPKSAKNKELDDDLGFYWRFEEELHRGMFKTTTVRNSQLTAPYMHNGIYNTLEEVIDFYNKGGGGGLGFDLPHQTLPFDNLKLTNQEQKAIIAYLKTLTDSTIETEY